MVEDNTKIHNLSKGLANFSIDCNNGTVSTEKAHQNMPQNLLATPTHNSQEAAFQDIEDQIALIPDSQPNTQKSI